ncbi:Gfo/Idh/MocA family protein [Lachnoclostridium phytofermentans]|jgi:predicted dehydrogenase|uniref:Gfo/Idh/MocA family protein n=1 Tax=Lachnoclostridium phytofermentans TaxID=66219 RepID=UPI0004972DBC|nr:Gfo/Idh/MocA family oxidoreductase [Lachnoclostridium phytofermentans]
MEKVNVGIIGCGNISNIYMQNITKLFINLNLYAVCDLDEEKAKVAAEKFQIEHVLTYEEMIHSSEITMILNLTTPKSHYSICKDALLAGKHVYVEKPLSLKLEEGKELVVLAREKKLLLGCAPDTFLGAGIQTCIKAINDGYIGEVIGATAFMMCHGHESWHPDPEFYYQTGGGPMFDMGPYYLTALVSMIGPVKEVVGMNSITFPTRTITSEKKFGEVVPVEVPTHVTGLLRFENGAIGNIITSFDVWGSTLPRIEVYGTRGSLIVPDPNCFDGEVLMKQYFSKSFEAFPLSSIYNMNSRGAGLSDMANCVLNQTDHNRASGELACHVLEIMHALHTSQKTKAFVELTTHCNPPKPLEMNLIQGSIS